MTDKHNLFMYSVFRLSPKEAPLPSVIGVSWTAVLSPMIMLGLSSIPLYLLLIFRIFVKKNGKRENITTSIVSLKTYVDTESKQERVPPCISW